MNTVRKRSSQVKKNCSEFSCFIFVVFSSSFFIPGLALFYHFELLRGKILWPSGVFSEQFIVEKQFLRNFTNFYTTWNGAVSFLRHRISLRKFSKFRLSWSTWVVPLVYKNLAKFQFPAHHSGIIWSFLFLFRFTGKLFGGLKLDIKHRFSEYKADWVDGCKCFCIAAMFFLYFSIMVPEVTFGANLS